jgi:hypothetical protein
LAVYRIAPPRSAAARPEPMRARLDPFERRLLVAAAIFVAGLAVFAFAGHPVLAVGVENDGYVGEADLLLRGELPRDEYHPLLYPLLVAGTSLIVGNTFAAAKLVSVLAAGGFLVAAALLARRLFGGAVAAVTALLLAGNAHVLVYAVQASTDMLNAALVTLALWLALRTLATPRRAEVVALAGACALAYFTRYQSALLLLPALLAVWIAPAPHRAARSRRVLGFGVALVAFLVPHLALTWASFGTPLHDASWRNIALRHFGAMDYSAIAQLPFDGVLSVLLHDPATLLQHAGADLAALLRRDAPALLLGGAPGPLAGLAVLLLVLAGAALGLRHARTGCALVLLFAVIHVLATSLLFVALPRLLLPTLPVWYAAASFALGRASLLAHRALRAWWKRLLVPATAAALLALLVAHAPGTVHAFAGAHPWHEIQAARELLERRPYPFRALAQYGAMGRVVGPSFLWIRALGAPDPAEYLRRAIDDAIAQRAEFLLIGAVSLGDQSYFDRLCAIGDPRLEPVRRDERVLVLRVRGVAPDWIARGHAEPAERTRGPLALEVRLREDVDPEQVGPVHVVITSPAGQRVVHRLERAAPLVYRSTMDDPQLVPGAWTVLPFVADLANTFGAGPAFSFVQR